MLLFVLFSLSSCSYISSLFGKVDEGKIRLDILNFLDKNVSENTWDITIVTPKKIKRSEKNEIIIFYRIKEKDFRSYSTIIYDGSNYNIINFKSEENTSRHIAVPRKTLSLWIDVEDRIYPFRNVESLELKCQLIDNRNFVPAKLDDEIVLNNRHIGRVEPHRYVDTEPYHIRIYLTTDGKRIMKDVAKNDYSKKLGIKIGFISYTTQQISREDSFEWITVYTKYSLENTKMLIKALLNKKDMT